MRFLVIIAALAMILWQLIGCTSTINPGTDGGSDVSRIDGSEASIGCASGCNDSIDCTDDVCMNDMCVHVPVPARCMAGASCDLRMGCRMGQPCAGTTDCADTDLCTTHERCDSASRTCLFDLLDGDGDGIPPRVCGGGDCDDSNSRVRPGAPEDCNGVDDDCDGVIDNGADGTCNAGDVCRMGRCVFQGCTDPTLTLCADRSCVDLATNSNFCGSCDRYCVSGLMMGPCAGGQCQCPAGERGCDVRDPPGLGGRLATVCRDLQTDPFNCGGCGTQCTGGMPCINGICMTMMMGCATGMTSCGGMCVTLSSDRVNCGACGVNCGPSGTCSAGLCQYTSCPTAGMMVCGGTSICVYQDPRNCGTCGRMCASGQTCTRGTCM